MHTLIRCESCHIDATFEGLPTQCSGCHDGKFARGKDVSHIPVTAQCDSCHTPRGFNVTAIMDHSVTSRPCFDCHNGTTAIGKSTDHPQTTNTCASCHVTTNWKASAFDHTETTAACVTCHNGNNATGKSARHVDTTNVCGSCHGTLSFAPALIIDHNEVQGSCGSSGCHTKPAIHATTTNLCESCHRVRGWRPALMDLETHKQVLVGRCSECHDSKGFTVVVSGIGAPSQPPTHIPTLDSCDLCHTTTAWLPHTFTHEKLNITNNCSFCHRPGIDATPKNATHIQSSDVCEACHLSMTVWKRPQIKMDHTQTDLTRGCVICHDNVIATGKEAKLNHIPTVQECNICHTTTAWKPAAVDHSTLIDNCVSCHNKVNASGKGGKHDKGLNTSDACQACHKTFPGLWADKMKFDHTQGLGACADCHNAVLATGKGTTTHIPTTLGCASCHTVTAWLGAKVDHATLTLSCVSCHSGTFTNVNGKNRTGSKHNAGLTTSDACERCHNVSPALWKPAKTFDHTQTTALCTTCHDGTLARGKNPDTHIITTDACDKCHTTVSWTGATVDHAGITSGCANCHDGIRTTGFDGRHNQGLTTSNSCQSCHKTKPATFKDTLKFDHAQALGTCAECHNGVAARGKSPTLHIPTTGACEACHTIATWLGAKVNHATLIASCVSCHTGDPGQFTGATGKIGNHSKGMVTSDACDRCHNVSPALWKPTKTFDHAETTATCASCHDGLLAKGKGINHVVTTAACDLCHKSVTTWLGAAVDHTTLTGTCVSCHDGVKASGKSRTGSKHNNGLNTSNECQICHKTFPLAWADQVTFDHLQIQPATACATCHDGTGMRAKTGKGSTHVPTTAGCETCHTSFVTWVKPALSVSHTGFTNNCVSCHTGPAAGTYQGAVGLGGKHTQGLVTTNLCESCHKKFPELWKPIAQFDHTQTNITLGCFTCHDGVLATTKKGPTHARTDNVCEACHSYTVWAPLPGKVDHLHVTPSMCNDCHGAAPAAPAPAAIATAVGQPPGHIPTAASCDLCHTTIGWTPNTFTHEKLGITTNCVTCHTPGLLVLRFKTATHIASTDVCEKCHLTMNIGLGPVAWKKPYIFVDHTQTQGACSSCHNNVVAIGKNPTTHIVTTLECGTCHTTTTWLGAAIDHTGITTGCLSCHDGVKASGKARTGSKHNNGLNTTDACELCHKTFPLKWADQVVFDHAQISPATACGTCHDGTGLRAKKGKGPAHLPTTDACDTCHMSVVSWLKPTVNVNHSSFVSNCVSCHSGAFTGATGKTGKHLVGLGTTNLCEVCHNNKPTSWKTIKAFDHAQISPPQACADCHNGTGAIAKLGKPTNHIPTAQACEVCHNTTAWAGAKVSHTTLTVTCVSCHTGNPGAFIGATGKVGKHVTGLTTSDACEKCHNVSPAGWKPTKPFDHTQTTATCASCHGTGLATRGKAANHVPTTLACDACHSVTVWTGAKVNHSTLTASCVTCHVGDPGQFQSARGKVGKHSIGLSTTDACDRCHNISPALFKPARTFDHSQTTVTVCGTCHNNTLAQGKSSGHIVTALDCVACHSTANWTATTPDHSGFTSNCISCHDGVLASGKNRTGSKHNNGLNTSNECQICHKTFPLGWKDQVVFDHAQISPATACGTCHDGTGLRAKNTKGATHIPTTGACDACHTSVTTWLKPTAVVDHTSFVNNCGTCHTGTFIGAVGKTGKHLVGLNTTNACEACHNNKPTSWKTVKGFDHAQISPPTPCATCHNGTGAIAKVGKSTSHIPTTQACDVCHNTNGWGGAKVNHTTLTVACDTCHTPTGTFIGARGFGGKHSSGLTTSTACGSCHNVSPAGWRPIKTFDHAQTSLTCSACHGTGLATRGLPGNHIPITQGCNVCHTTNGWSGAKVNHSTLAATCVACHVGDPGNFLGARGKIGKHSIGLSTSDACDRCHNLSPALFKPARTFDHTQTTVTICGTCHNNTLAQGKGSGHIATTLDCLACHTTANWTATTPDHTTFTSNCISCHDGARASGKSGKHSTGLTTSNECHLCHKKFPLKWRDQIVFDHSQTTLPCSSCHGTGLAKTGKSASHIPTTLPCGDCHTVARWSGASTNHTTFFGNCITCHTGTFTGATGKSGKHTAGLSTSDLCDACHAKKPGDWTPIVTFNHLQTSVTTCSTCHNTTLARGKGVSHPLTSNNCASCHSNSSPWGRPSSGQMNHNETTASCAAAGCHISTRSASHIAIVSPPLCANCHTTTSWNTIIIVDHSQIQNVNNCVLCHIAGGIAAGKSGLHNQVTQISNNCGACHFTPPQNFGSYKTPFPHSEVTATCVTCHTDSGSPFRGRGTSHLKQTSTDCAGCHSSTTSWAIATVNHAFVTGTCISCHDGSTGGQSLPSGHCPIGSNDCNVCHGSVTSWTANITDLCPVAAPPPPPPPVVPPPPPPPPPPPMGGGMGGGGMGGGM